MIRRSLIAALALTAAATAGEVQSVNFLYNQGQPFDSFEIDIKTRGECLVAPTQSRGTELVAQLIDCRLNRPYSIGKRGDFILGATLQPQGDDALLIVKLAKEGALKTVRTPSGYRLEVTQGAVLKPNINVVKTVSGEELIVELPPGVTPTYKRVGNRLIIDVPGVIFEAGYIRLNAQLATGATVKTTPQGSTITVALSPQVGAVEVTTQGTTLLANLYRAQRPNAPEDRDLKVALKFTNADVKAVIRAIANVAKINVVFDSEVRGKVNVDFGQPIYWKDALKAVVDSAGLTFIETPQYYRILPKNKVFIEQAIEPVKTYVVTLNYVKADKVAKIIEDIIKAYEIVISKTEDLSNDQENENQRENRDENQLQSETDRINELVKELSQKISKKMQYGKTGSKGATEDGSRKSSFREKERELEKELAKLLKKWKDTTKNKMQNKTETKINSRESVSYNEETNSLILRLTESHYRDIKRVIELLDRPRKQILVRAKILLISSRAEKDLGFTWFISGYNRLGDSSQSAYLASTYGFNTQDYTPLITPDTYMKLSNMPVMDNTLALGILNKTQTLKVELALKALELEGDAKTISSPRVLTLDNQEASIEQGIEIPYRETTVAAGGATTYAINFKKASLILKVKPHVIENGKIIMDVEVRKDSPNYEYVAITGNNEPAINTRNVKSRVVINNGSTVVIGGIYEKEKSKNVTGVPVISRIPLLGWLFKSTNTTVSKTQLLIFITPNIVDSQGTEIAGGIK